MNLNEVLIPLESGKFLNVCSICSGCSIGLNPFGVREVSKPMRKPIKRRIVVLIPLESGKFLNFIFQESNCFCKCLNPFGVREVSKQKKHCKLKKKSSLNPFGVREVSKLKMQSLKLHKRVLIPLESGKFLNLKAWFDKQYYPSLNPFGVREVSKLILLMFLH